MADTVVDQVESATAVGEVNNEQHEEIPAPVTPAGKRGPAAPKTPRKTATPKATVDADGNPIPKTPRKTATPKATVDADGNPIPKTPRKTATPKATVDADGKPLPKTPRKPATPKQPRLDAEGNPSAATPKKSASKAKAKAVKSEGSQAEGSGGDSKLAVDMGDDVGADDVAPPATPASKKRGSIAGAAETPSKRVKGNALPTCKAELSEQDKVLMEWKEQGRSWTEITAEYARITGKPCGKSTLPVRYGRLKASLVELKEGDMERVLLAKDIINELQAAELEQFKKKQETDVWGRVATHITTIGGDTYTGEAIQKAYAKEKRDNFPHLQTELMAQFQAGEGLQAEGASQDDAEGVTDIKDEVDVDFDANGDPVYTDAAEQKTPETVIHKKSISEAPANGTRKESIAESATSKSTADNSASEATTQATSQEASQEDDGAVFD